MSSPHTTRRLVLLRHATAEAAGHGPDAQRPLALTGRKQATRVGQGLLTRDLLPDGVLCSDAVRTRQTWDLVRGGLGGREQHVTIAPELYEADVEGVLGLVRAAPDTVSTLLVVGHEPVMSALAEHLAGPGSDSAALAQVQAGLPTATYVVVDVVGGWADVVRRGAVLSALVHPDA